MKKLRRYSKKVTLAIVMVFAVAVTGVFSASFNSNASNVQSYQYYSVVMDKPSVNDSSGYLEILFRTSSGALFVTVFYWSLFDSGVENPYMDIVINSSGNLSFMPMGASTYEMGYIYDSSSNPDFLGSGITDPYNRISFNTSHTIVGFRAYGNYSLTLNGSFDYYNSERFVVLYGVEANEFNKLMNIYNQLLQSNSNDVTIIDKLNDIMNSNDSIDSKISQLIELQKNTNTWLQKIWNSIQEFITPNDADEEAANDFNAESEAQKNEIDSLNQQNQTEKVDVNSATSQVDSNINYDNMAEYGGVLATITNNNYVLQMILIVVSVAIIAYVLFGKR